MTVRGLTAALALSLTVPAVAAAPAEITRRGVGDVERGATHRSLREQGLVGPQEPGCELGGERQKAAELRKGLEGAVELTRGKPRRVRSIVVTDGAQARGVGIGARRADIRAAFPHARFDRSTEEVFGVMLATVPRRDGGRIQFGLDADTREVTLIGVPYIAFCE
jgi:hypothetical protein